MKKSLIFKLFCVVLSLLTVVCAFSACGKDEEEKVPSDLKITRVRFDMECDGEKLGSFIVELYPEYAPITVANFIELVESGFYDGVPFHRVYEGFMAQGGDPDGDGKSDPDAKTIKGEFSANGVENNLSHDRGVISMARTNDFNSASSQFFICYSGDYKASLDGYYAAFGKVIEGMEVVDSFLKIEREYNGERVPTKPVKPIVITRAEIVE